MADQTQDDPKPLPEIPWKIVATGIAILVAVTVALTLGSMIGPEISKLNLNQAFVLFTFLVWVLFFAAFSAVVTGYLIAKTRGQEALGLIALIVAPMLSLITALTGILSTVVKSVIDTAK